MAVVGEAFGDCIQTRKIGIGWDGNGDEIGMEWVWVWDGDRNRDEDVKGVGWNGNGMGMMWMGWGSGLRWGLDGVGKGMR